MLFRYPYTDSDKINLDWIIAKIKEVTNTVDEFVALNKLTWRGAWNIGDAYPIWSIVDDNGDGYVSIKPVPRNVEITNTEYWQMVASYSGLYAAFEQRIEVLENDIDIISKSLTDRWLIISDSYGTDYANPTGDSRTIFTFMRQFSGRDETSLTSLAFSGGGFINNSGGYTFLQGLQNRLGELGDLSTFSKVIVVAGRNDYIASTSSIEAAISQFVSYVKAHFTNAKCYLGFIANGTNSGNGTRAEQMAVYYAYKNGPKYGAYYLDGVECILKRWDLYMSSDGVHPNINGKEFLAINILNAINNGSCSVTMQIYGLIFGLESGVSQVNVAPNTLFLTENNMTSIYPTSSGSFSFGSTTGQYNVIKKLGFTTNETYIHNPSVPIKLPYTVDVYNDNTKVASNGYLAFNPDGELFLGFYTPTNVTFNNVICFENGTITLPTVYI